MPDDDDILRPALRAMETGEADQAARRTAEGLISAHVSEAGKVHDLGKFTDSIAAAMIAARTAGRLEK
jgi:hypothetical protein